MFITFNPENLVTAYSDKLRYQHDLQEGEQQAEIDLEFAHIDCKENSLTFVGGKLLNNGIVIANQI